MYYVWPTDKWYEVLEVLWIITDNLLMSLLELINVIKTTCMILLTLYKTHKIRFLTMIYHYHSWRLCLCFSYESLVVCNRLSQRTPACYWLQVTMYQAELFCHRMCSPCLGKNMIVMKKRGLTITVRIKKADVKQV